MIREQFIPWFARHCQRNPGVQQYQQEFFDKLRTVSAEDAEASSLALMALPKPDKGIFPADNLSWLLREVRKLAEIPARRGPPDVDVDPLAAVERKGGMRSLLDELRAKGLWKPKDQRGGIRKVLPTKPKPEEEKVPF